LTTGNLKIMVRNRRQKIQKLPKIDASTFKNQNFVLNSSLNFSTFFKNNLLGPDQDAVSSAAGMTHVDRLIKFEDDHAEFFCKCLREDDNYTLNFFRQNIARCLRIIKGEDPFGFTISDEIGSLKRHNKDWERGNSEENDLSEDLTVLDELIKLLQSIQNPVSTPADDGSVDESTPADAVSSAAGMTDVDRLLQLQEKWSSLKNDQHGGFHDDHFFWNQIQTSLRIIKGEDRFGCTISGRIEDLKKQKKDLESWGKDGYDISKDVEFADEFIELLQSIQDAVSTPADDGSVDESTHGRRWFSTSRDMIWAPNHPADAVNVLEPAPMALGEVAESTPAEHLSTSRDDGEVVKSTPAEHLSTSRDDSAVVESTATDAVGSQAECWRNLKSNFNINVKIVVQITKNRSNF